MVQPKFIIIIFLIVLFAYMISINDDETETVNKIEIKGESPVVENMYALENLPEFRGPKKIEITNLQTITPQVFLRYKSICNHLENDGRKIRHNSIRFLDNVAIINGFRYGLSCLEWHKSIMNWYGQEVGLELRIVHSLVEKNKTIIFIIPLSLVDIKRENFVELSYNKNKENIPTLNSLITKSEQVPCYICCDPNTGPIVSANLKQIEPIILNQPFFYKYDMSDSITYYILKPQPYDRYIGLNIRSKLVG